MFISGVVCAIDAFMMTSEAFFIRYMKTIIASGLTTPSIFAASVKKPFYY
jgi:hypothetical protein